MAMAVHREIQGGSGWRGGDGLGPLGGDSGGGGVVVTIRAYSAGSQTGQAAGQVAGQAAGQASLG